MKNGCPPFELLSRFADGALEAPEDRELAVHLAGCPACRAALASIDEVDGLLALSLPAATARRFRLLRPAMIPVAAAVLIGVTIGILFSMPSPNGADTPLAVAEVSPQAVARSAEPVRDVFCQDQFASVQLSSMWKATEIVSGANPLVDSAGRRALSLAAQPGGKKRWAIVSTSSDFPVGDGVSFDVDYRVPKPQKGGRMQVLLQSRSSKAGRQVLRWSRTADEEMLEAQSDGRSKPAVLWTSKSAADGEWHRVKLVVTPRDVVLSRDGVEAARKPHGLSLERAGLSLGSTMDRRTREPHEPFECQVGGVVVRREPAQ